MIRLLLTLIALLTTTLHLHAADKEKDKPPAGYVLQIMEPTGGRIFRPKGWFYYEAHRESTFMWTISKEDTRGGKGTYSTGVRIQAFASVQANTGQTPQAFVKDFLAKKKKTAKTVHRECDAARQDLFTRMCLEITEGENRILYSVFWGNDIDIAVVSIAGAKTADWDANANFFDTMSAFTLIDMKRFPDTHTKDDKTGAKKPAKKRTK